jgi:L-fuculose-phosphate aldolase
VASPYDIATAKRELLAYGRRLADRLLVVGPGGNTSARAGNAIVMKASGSAFEDCTEDDYVPVDLATGDVLGSERKPSCEIFMHLACYLRRPDVNAVIHTHPPVATGIASAGQSLPPLYPDLIALVGRRIPLVPYIVPGGKALANAVAAVIADHNAVLLGNHGVLTVGTNIREAYFRNLLIEEAAKTWLAARAAGTPYVLTPEQVDEVDHLEAEDFRRALLRGEIAPEPPPPSR